MIIVNYFSFLTFYGFLAKKPILQFFLIFLFFVP